MSIPVLTFFNNKGGVGKTSLVYHLSWMLTELGRSVLVVDLDPQANLTAAFLDEDELIDIFDEPKPDAAATIYQCVQPLTHDCCPGICICRGSRRISQRSGRTVWAAKIGIDRSV